MTPISRNLVVPMVLGVWAVALIVGVYTVAVISGFIERYDFYSNSGVGHALIATALRHGYPLGAALGLGALVVGVWILRKPECGPGHLIWFATGTIVAAIAWFIGTLLAERSIYVLSQPV
jgi:hypothetical protein